MEFEDGGGSIGPNDVASAAHVSLEPHSAECVACNKCNARLAPWTSFFFFMKNQKDVQLALNPGDITAAVAFKAPKNKDGAEKRQMQNIHCAGCDGKIGNSMAQPDKGGHLDVFGGEKVHFLTSSGERAVKHTSARIRWGNVYKLPALSHMRRSTEIYNDSEPPQKPPTTVPSTPLVTPTEKGCVLSMEECLDWRGLLEPRCGIECPRKEQIEAFQRCMLHNHIVVLPTGFGKTLIAAMVMKRMVKLNPAPGRVALMIVDRLPLVEQQKAAIENYTGLNAACLSSETTRYSRLRIFEGFADVLVATAGALSHYLEDAEERFGVIFMSSFSVVVFDECHHADKGHTYAELLSLIKDTPPAHRPRLVGLTASPCKAKTVEQALKGLGKLLKKFGHDTLLYRPSLHCHRKGDETVAVTDAPMQMEVGDTLWERIDEICTELQLVRPGSDVKAATLDELLDSNSIGVIKGKARELANSPDSRASSKELMRLLTAWVRNAVLGPYAARWDRETLALQQLLPSTEGAAAQSNSTTDTSRHTVVPEKQLSAQLIELESRLKDAEEKLQSKGDKLRCLVFVDTKDTAEMLTRRLEVTFPDLRPNKVVGQNMGGMMLSVQRQRIKEFRSGACRLLVCTSVLEEGFDVPECNLVIRIHARASLIQQVQCRGRARAVNGSLVTISSTRWMDHAKELENQENNLESALAMEQAKAGQVKIRRTLRRIRREDDDDNSTSTPADDNGDGSVMSTLSASAEGGGGDDEEQQEVVEESIEDVLEGVRSYGIPPEGLPSLDTASGEESAASWVSSAAIKIFLNVDEDASRYVVDNMRRAIENMACLPQGTGGEDGSFRIYMGNNDLGDFGAAGSRRVLDGNRLAILSIPTGSRKFLKGFVSSWDFLVKGATEVSIALPPPAHHGASGGDCFQEGASLPIDGVMRVSLGYMPSHGTFVRCETLSDTRRPHALSYATFEVQSGRRWTLRGFESSGEVGLEVTAPISNLGPCLYLSALKKDGSVTVYMPLKSTPSVFVRKGQHRQRASVPHEVSRGAAARDDTASNETTPGDSASSAMEAAEKHLSILAMHPVLAVEFSLDQWENLVAVLQDPRNLGVAALATRVHGQFSESQTESLFIRGKSRPLEERQPGRNLITKDATVTDALFAFGCLETHIYCLPLHPKCLGSIMRDVKAALAEHLDEGNSTHIRVSTKAMQYLYAHVDSLCPFEDAAAIYHALVHQHGLSSGGGSGRTVSGLSTTDDDGSSDDKYFKISRVVVTPSRIVCKPGILMKSSRLMRLFALRHKLVYVTFRDEDGQPLYSRFEGRCSSMLEPSGITSWQLQGLELRLLVCSASQMREQTAVFVASSDSQEEVERMHSELIKNKEQFKGQMFKYMSRMGLFCTSESPVLDVVPGDWETIEDSLTADKTKVLTDGSGFIDRELLSQISHKFPSVVPPGCCAIQIRHSGNKGVLVASPMNRPGRDAISPGKKVAMRRSMVKFESDHGHLCVVKAAVYHPLRLNRDILNLLFSVAGSGAEGDDWDVYPVVNAMQDEELSRLAMVLIDHQTARLELVEHTAFDRRDLKLLVQCAEVFPNERHFCRLLRHIYDYKIKHLRTKTHIPVELGALLMGIPDPFGILDDGEIFLQIRKNNDDTADDDQPTTTAEVITGSVLLYRNPLLHPGDTRVLNAVDLADKGDLGAELKSQYVNVVVFPARDGVTERCIPSECSGGDLDGDMFSVIWDPRLVPPPRCEMEAFDYEAHAAESKESNPEPPDLSSAETISLSMTNACLGKLARMHLAVSDIQEHGARDALAIKLAEQQSLAVDFPKTGVAPVVPEAAKKLVKENGHPDFMETKNKQGYLSKKPLGLLYQQCQAIACEISLGSSASETSTKDGVPDGLYATPGHEAHLADAEKAFRAYRRDIQTALLHFGLSSEVELILALPMQLPEELESNRQVVEQALSDMWQSIKEKYRSWFTSGADDDDSSAPPKSDDELLDKASAWYVVAYRSRGTRPPHAAEEGSSNNEFALPLKSAADDDRSGYLGFPWIVSDMLAKVRERQWNSASSAEGRNCGAARMMSAGEDAKAHWKNKIHPLVTQVMGFRMAAFNIVRDAIRQYRDAQQEGEESRLLSSSAEVFIFGSVSQFLCVTGSDIDIYVHEPGPVRGHEGQEKESLLLQSPVSAALEDVALKKWFVNGNQSGVPVLRTVISCGEELSADVCARPDGVYKTMLLRKLYDLDPCYLPLLACVTEWARACALIRSADEEDPSGGSSCAPLKSGELHALFLHVLQEHMCNDKQSGDLKNRDIVPCANEVVDLRIEESETFPRAHHESGDDDQSSRYLSNADTCEAALLGKLLLAFFDAGSRLPHHLGQEGLVYEWPLPCQPPAVHTIKDGDTLKDVARRCARAKHCLARTGSWKAVLDQASGLNDTMQDFTYKLPSAMAQRLIDSAAFHEVSLQALSKAETVWFDIQPGSNITVRARGTPQQIQALRALLNRMHHSRRAIGTIQCRKGVYFMDNSTFLFARGAASSSPMLRISNYIFDGINIRHLNSEISSVALQSAFCVSKDRWKEEFVARYADKVMEQAERVAEEDRSSATGLVDSLRLSVHFGHYYLLNASRFFEGKSASVSLSEVVEALESLSHRKQYGRPDYEDRPLPHKGIYMDQETANEGNSGGSDDQSSLEGDSSNEARKSSRPNLNAGFRNCVIPRKIKVQSDLNNLVPDIEAWADAVFVNGLGYEQVPQEGESPLVGSDPSSVFNRPRHAWQVEVVASGSYQVSVKLDAELNVSEVKERPLRWIHGTLLQTAATSHDQDCNEEQSPSVGADGKPLDMRLKFSTETIRLQSGNALHDTACPEGKAPICVDANGRPSPSSDLNANVQRRVTFARRIQRRREYRIKIPASAIITTKAPSEHLITAPAAAFDVDVLVVLAFAMHYEGGDGLEDVMPMVDVSLDVDMAPLKQYLREMQKDNDLGGCSTPPPRDSAADAATEPTAARATREAIHAWQNKYIRHLLDILDCMNQNSHLLKNL